jgi:hypothetical protein
MSVPAVLALRVRRRAGERCEYCRMSQILQKNGVSVEWH